MTWTHSQSSGTLSRDGSLVARGYSGHGAGKNNPVMQAVRSVGPIPEGHPGSGSNGCIVISDRIVRERVWSSGDRQLRVER
ncbi:hypothetical protein GCT19_27215 [Paraburkholderia sp. CNPSo 3155]|nr:hypothetical protein [Paraburkholderia atlantica]